MIALIDADPLFYKLAFGAEEKSEFPESYIKHDILKMFKDVQDEAGCTKYRAFMTTLNYRYGFASLDKYKGQRGDKPKWLAKIREVGSALCSELPFEVNDFIEADDKLGIAAGMLNEKGIPWVICTIDKDLDQIAGNHFRWSITNNKKQKIPSKSYAVTQAEADRFLYLQALTGDRVDNIKGLHGVGQKTAEKKIPEGLTEEEMFQICWDFYKEKGRSLADLIETLHLVYIMRTPFFYRVPL